MKKKWRKRKMRYIIIKSYHDIRASLTIELSNKKTEDAQLEEYELWCDEIGDDESLRDWIYTIDLS
jgi:hypothetical protein